jgi:Capsule assembly protein Wzi
MRISCSGRRTRRISVVLSGLLCIAAVPSAQAGESLADSVQRERETAPDTAPATVQVVAADPLLRSQVWLVAPALGGFSGARLAIDLKRSAAVRLRLGLGWREGASRQFSAEGSEAAWVLGASEVYASVQRRHWGPGRAGSLILDGAAEALPAIGWRRPVARASDNALLHFLGPWSGDFFVGGLQGHQQPPHPFLIGMRIEAQPLPNLRLGAARTMQWGGGGRPEGLASLLHALLGSDNAGYGGISADNEPGNQLAGVDWRWTLWPRQDLAWYGQIVGEDEAGKLPSANLALAGVDTRWPLGGSGTVRAFVEWTNTLAGAVGRYPRPGAAYRHHIYRQGYTHDGLLLGHPAGGDVELTSAGLLIDHGALAATVVAARGRALPTAQRFLPGRLEVVNASAQWRLAAGQSTGVGLWWLRSAAGRDASAQWWWQYAWP